MFTNLITLICSLFILRITWIFYKVLDKEADRIARNKRMKEENELRNNWYKYDMKRDFV